MIDPTIRKECRKFDSKITQRGSRFSQAYALRIYFCLRECCCRFSTSANFFLIFQIRNRAAIVRATMLTASRNHSIAPHSSNILSPHNGGRRSISTSPFGHPIQPSLAPSSTTSSSKPGGSISGNGTSPDKRVTMHVPQVPDEQFVGIETPASSASSTRVKSACTVACPSNCIPRKNRTTAPAEMVPPQRPGLFRVQRPVCLLKNKPAFFIHLLNLVAPAPVRRMKSSRSSCAWI